MEWALVGLVVALIAWFLYWTVAPVGPGALISSEGNGYYNLQIRGFLKGQLALDAPADPVLATLENPYDPVQRAGRGMHDATYYRGRYFMYFGVTPALTLFLPFKLLTGSFLAERAASLVFSWIGLVTTAGLVVAVRRRYFPEASTGWLVSAVLVAGLVTMVPAMLRRPSVWEVPISGAYAFFMLAMAALYQVVHSRHRATWLAVTSTLLGLAIGARPLYLIGAWVVALPLVCWARELGWRLVRLTGSWWRWLTAAVLPAACIGVGLAVYNYLRFDNPLEFGQTYQMAGEDVSKLTLFNPAYAWYGMRIYLLAAPGWTPFFPFLTVITPPPAPSGQFGIENPYGVFPSMPVVLFGLLLLGLWWRSGMERHPLRLFVVCLAGAMTSSALAVFFFGGATNRYMVDFVPGASLLAAFGALSMASWAVASWWWRWARAGLWFGLALYSIGFNLLVSLQHNQLLRAEHPEVYARVAHGFNRVSDVWGRLMGAEFGPVEMTVVFPRGAVGQIEPLVVTGHAFLSDFLFVHYTGEDSLRFGLEHTSRGNVIGRVVIVDMTKEHVLRMEMGSLYPPVAHPYFDGMEQIKRRERQRLVRVWLDGAVVLERNMECYDASGFSPDIGHSGRRLGFGRPFSGRILDWRRVSMEVVPPSVAHTGALRLRLQWPAFSGPRSEPLVCSGETGRGNLVYVSYVDPTHVRFGMDYWGAGAVVSELVEVDPAAVTVVDVDYGALQGNAGTAGERIVIRVNDRTVFEAAMGSHACEPDTVVVGENPIGASTAVAQFSGDLLGVERLKLVTP